MKKTILAAILAGSLAFAMTAPAAGQNYPLDYGGFAEVTGIDIIDGGGVEYANYLATQWRKNQEHAKAQGWITDYKVYANLHPREDEPDLYLMVMYANIPDAAEATRRDAAFRDFQKKTDSQMASDSGNRGKFRKIKSNSLLGELLFRN